MPARSFVPALRWSALSRLYDPLTERWMPTARMREGVITALELRPGLRLLELGCGPGRLAIALKHREPDLAVQAIDIDPVMIARARRLAEETGADVVFNVGDISALATSGPFDRVYSTLVFHHLTPEQKAAALREARRVLRADGLLVIADFGRPRGLMQAVLSEIIHPLDGRRSTTPHRRGGFEAMIRAEFPRTTVAAAWRTMFGTIELFVCRPN